MTERLLTIDQVKAGADLPELGYDVTATTVVLGALASRDWRPMHHDKDFAQNRNGTRDIFLNTPNQAAWFERYLTDWSGPYGRLGRMKFRMRDSVFPGDRMVFRGHVESVHTDDAGCGWADVTVKLSVGDKLCTECNARIALPAAAGDNPWTRRGERWKPEQEAETASVRR
jgi:acyl dehydratase